MNRRDGGCHLMPRQSESCTIQRSQVGGVSGKGQKAYRAPLLCCYGDVSSVTQAVGMAGNKDGGSGNTQKTH
jgi:hypothetical protein